MRIEDLSTVSSLRDRLVAITATLQNAGIYAGVEVLFTNAGGMVCKVHSSAEAVTMIKSALLKERMEIVRQLEVLGVKIGDNLAAINTYR